VAWANTFLSRWAKLYVNLTTSELALEPAIAALGLPYRVQHPVFATGSVLDFAIYPRGVGGPKLAIEVDGKEHRTTAGKAKDAERSAKLKARGWTVVRVTNEEAKADPRGTVERVIKPALQQLDRKTQYP